jgi:PleD family two-component response regulator
MERRRIPNREMFLYLLDLEIKRAIRYQNFFCILKLKLSQLPENRNGKGPQVCYQTLRHLLIEEMRESDILGSLGDDQLAILIPYADPSAGSSAKSRLEGSLKYFEFKKEGYEVMVDQISFPLDGTDTPDLVGKLLEQRNPDDGSLENDFLPTEILPNN